MTDTPSKALPSSAPDCVDDTIYGAVNIAKFLKVTARAVYYCLELKKAGKSDAPIHKKPMLGIYASRKDLLEYMKTGR